MRLLEKSCIIDFIDDTHLLNKRNEIISGCEHENKLLLKNVKWCRYLLGNLNCFGHTHERIFLVLIKYLYSLVVFRWYIMYTWWLLQHETQSCILEYFLNAIYIYIYIYIYVYNYYNKINPHFKINQLLPTLFPLPSLKQNILIPQTKPTWENNSRGSNMA